MVRNQNQECPCEDIFKVEYHGALLCESCIEKERNDGRKQEERERIAEEQEC